MIRAQTFLLILIVLMVIERGTVSVDADDAITATPVDVIAFATLPSTPIATPQPTRVATPEPAATMFAHAASLPRSHCRAHANDDPITDADA